MEGRGHIVEIWEGNDFMIVQMAQDDLIVVQCQGLRLRTGMIIRHNGGADVELAQIGIRDPDDNGGRSDVIGKNLGKSHQLLIEGQIGKWPLHDQIMQHIVQHDLR